MRLSFAHFVLGDLATNCYVIHNGKEAMLIDPAVGSEELKGWIESQGLALRFIVNTHGHIDHIGGNAFFKECFPSASLIIHERDFVYLKQPELNLSQEIGFSFVSPLPDALLEGGESQIFLGEHRIEILHTPGHTPGSVCLFVPEEEWLFCGDTLFLGSVGRTDLPGGSFRELVESLERIFERFLDSVQVFPGHGPESTIGIERRTNAYYLMYVAQK